MNKKILLVVAVLLVAVFAMCACGTKSVLDLYDGVKQAKSITQTISVKDGSTEIASEKRVYNMETGKVTIERKTLSGELSASEPYTTTTETKNFEKAEAVAKLSGLTMTEVITTETSFKGTVANADLKTAFGVDGSKVKGDATVELLAKDGNVTTMTVSYVSSNDNAVTIVTTYAY